MARMFRSRRNRMRQPLSDIPLTPLIDTALTLLIIFMITAPMIQNDIRIDLPKGQVKEDTSPTQDLVVYIDKEEHIFLNGQQMDIQQALDEIKVSGRQKADQTLFVKADVAVSYGNVIEFVDKVKVIEGIKYVALATQQVYVG